MDLVKGTCFFCSNTKVVSDAKCVQNTILTLFTGTDVNEVKLADLKPPRVCHLCYHSFVLMKRTHDDILHSSSAEKVHENCHLCGNSEDVIRVSRWARFDKIGKDYRGLIGNNISNACSDCLYYLETKNSIKEKLLTVHPELKLESFSSNVSIHSTPKRTRTKAERKVPLEFIDLTETNNSGILKHLKPLKSYKNLKKSKLISKDFKLMNQILIIKLCSLNNKTEPPLVVKKKISPQKKVRFKDVHELEEDIGAGTRKINYKETRYRDNFTIKNEDLVEYEIKVPRRSRFQDYNEDSSSDSVDGKRKSFFKIKLTKKKSKSVQQQKPAPNSKKRTKSRKKTPPAAPTNSETDSEEESKEKVVLKDKLVINLEQMRLPETNGVQEEESDGSLDPLRIESEGDSDNEKRLMVAPVLSETNGCVEENEPQMEVTVVDDAKEVITISSEDDGTLEDQETEEIIEDNGGETINEIKLFILQSAEENNKVGESEDGGNADTTDVQENQEENVTSDNNEEENNETVELDDKSNGDDATDQNVSQEDSEKVNDEEETENSQEETADSEDISEVLAETENSQETTENDQESTENSQEVTENSQEESEVTENSQEVTENISDEVENVCEEVQSVSAANEDEESKKRKRDEDEELSDSNTTEKKKKKVSFLDDVFF